MKLIKKEKEKETIFESKKMSDGGDTQVQLINSANSELLDATTQRQDEGEHKDTELKNEEGAQNKNENEKVQNPPAQQQLPPPPQPPKRKRGRPRKNSNLENTSGAVNLASEAFKRKQAQELAYYNSLKKRKTDESSTELLYYNIVTTERGEGKRKVKARDYVVDFDDYYSGSDGNDDDDDDEYKDNDGNENDCDNDFDSDFGEDGDDDV